MTDPTITTPKWGAQELTPLPGRYNSAIRALVASRIQESNLPWAELVLDGSLFTIDDAVAVEKDALDSGYRFEFSATASLTSEPEKYKASAKVQPSEQDTGELVDGRRLVGSGDNVIRKAAPISGPVALVSDVEQVMNFLVDGVPAGTIAVIDDSGGTLTAPILEGFAGIICLGGTVRSHLGILAREYDVPTLMNCKIGPLTDGDVVEIEITAAPPGPDAYETGDTGHARIWKLEGDH
ncbi:PEP-utilizing enzyme [Rhodococcoides kyotonense]|uniref:PEP-utilising enzyme, mobile domain n=1 Tax=Rhodococcoides kyotonense TaxID=398843 RepID=A0A239DV47_9NOCA|nr:PEP-utilizing enzyme [Rhodococcus kyotonensis]SNS35848.1 PEP-utilising enzyme, mobile domain [Rhodococcus kyotonensis]